MTNSPIKMEDSALHQEVSTWYHCQTLEMPPERLDQDILRLSQIQLAEMHSNKLTPPVAPIWRRLVWALSSAASLVIVVGLVMINRPQFEEELRELAVQPMSKSMPVEVLAESHSEDSNTAGKKAVARKEEVVLQASSAQETAQREVQTNMSTQETLQEELWQAPRIAPQNDIAATLVHDKAVLIEDLARLQTLVDSKQTQQALALEQVLMKQYPQLSKANGESTKEYAEQIAKFKALQQQLHQLSQ